MHSLNSINLTKWETLKCQLVSRGSKKAPGVNFFERLLKRLLIFFIWNLSVYAWFHVKPTPTPTKEKSRINDD